MLSKTLKTMFNPDLSGKSRYSSGGKMILCMVILISIASNLYCDYAVSSTRSMSANHMSAIRADFSGDDDVARHYWLKFKIHSTKDDSLEILETDGIRDPIFEENLSNTHEYAKEAIWGAVGIDMPVTTPTTTDSMKLDKARDYLLNPNSIIIDDYLNLEEIWDYYGITTNAGCTDIGVLTINVTLMVDMLWNYVNDTDRASMCAKLDSLADTLHYYIDRNKETWGLGDNPRSFMPNAPSAAVGYAGCILDDNYHIDFAKEMIFEYEIPYLADPQYGFLDFMTTNSNYIGEGLTYFGCNIYSGLNVFFTAYLRMYGENLYNRDIVKNTMSNVVNMIRPDMKELTLDDSYSHVNPPPSSYFDQEEFVQGLFEYYYNNTNNTEADNGIRWYFNEFKNRYNKYPPLLFRPSYFQPVFSYNPDKNICILDDPNYNIPESITNGSYTDDELTVFRNEINTQDDFKNSIQMYVNYDNALNPSFHEHSDQTSFQLFAYEKYLLIDPGYKTAGYSNWARNGIHWLHSPYAHNLIIINPDSLNEVEHLAHDYNGDPNTSDSTNNTIPLQTKEPLFRKLINPGNPQTMSVPNPSYKEYFINNEEIEKLKIHMDYIVDPIEDDTVRVERDFYFIGKEYFVIVDNLENKGEGYSNTFWNTLHFRPYKYSNNNLNTDDNGTFTLDAYDNVELYGAIGSSTPFYIGVDSEKPFGCYYWNRYHDYQHRRLKAVTESVNTKYLTILIPSESGSNPITVNDSVGYYAVEIYDASKTPTEKSYYAVSDSMLDISFNDIDINSDAAFVGLTYRPGFQFDTKITQFIMADGDILFYNDNDTLLVDPNSSIEEVIASYSGTELSVIVKSDDEYPQYRILRQGVEPDNFSSIGVADKENGTSNIKHLSYDSDYFYVNWYDFSSGSVNLITPILVPYGDTLVIGNGVTINCMNSDIKIEIEGEISIGDSVTFTSPDSVYWDGIYLNNSNSVIDIDYLTLNRGNLYNGTHTTDISHSEFNSSGISQTGRELIISYSEFDSSNVECQWLYPFGFDDLGVYISNCTLENYSDSVLYAIEVSGYPRYSITDNSISYCSGGINLNESGSIALCDISDNTITDNNGNGIVLYHSHGDITGHNDIEENTIGIASTHNSPLRVTGTEDTPYQTIKNNVYEEIKIDMDSAPEREQMYLNRVIDDSPIGGTNDQYLINCIRFEGGARSIMVENNYWGPASPEWQEWDGDELFYPDSAFDYIPVWEPKKNGNTTPAGILYSNADSLISQGKYQEAKGVYKTIIDLYPTTEYSMYSMRNLLSVETIYGQDFFSLQQYYLTEPNCNINYDRTKLSNYLANYCSIKMEEYAIAITFFEDIISNPDTEIDSVYAVIDAGYTYLLMENGSKSYKGRMTELIPKSPREFKKKRMKLLSRLLELPESDSEAATVDHKLRLQQNYPNPFGPSTVISFSLPLNVQKADFKIYNIKGQLVKEIEINTKSGIGSITWDGLDNRGKLACNGVYFYKLTADKKEIVKKMVLMR